MQPVPLELVVLMALVLVMPIPLTPPMPVMLTSVSSAAAMVSRGCPVLGYLFADPAAAAAAAKARVSVVAKTVCLPPSPLPIAWKENSKKETMR